MPNLRRKQFGLGAGSIAIIVATIGVFQGVPVKIIDLFSDTRGDRAAASPTSTYTHSPMISSTPATTTGKITFPPPGGMVKMESDFTGIATGIPEGHDVWAVVESEDKYYPQDGPYTRLPDGRWSGTVFIGDESESGESFVLHIVEAGPIGTMQFTEYSTKAGTVDNLAGMPRETVASDVQFLDKVGVVRE